MDPNAAERMIEKLRLFLTALDDEERVLFGQLLAPGIANAYHQDDVEGFTMTEWSPMRLPSALVDAVRGKGIHVVWPDP